MGSNRDGKPTARVCLLLEEAFSSFGGGSVRGSWKEHLLKRGWICSVFLLLWSVSVALFSDSPSPVLAAVERCCSKLFFVLFRQ